MIRLAALVILSRLRLLKQRRLGDNRILLRSFSVVLVGQR